MKERMQNQSDQELDNLFKRAAEQSEGDSAMPDWTDMNNRLDQVDRAGFIWQNKTVITGSILVLTVAVLVWWRLDTGPEGDEVRSPVEQVKDSKDISNKDIAHESSIKSSESKTSENELSETSSGFSRKDSNPSISDKDEEEQVSSFFSKPEKISVLNAGSRGVKDVNSSKEWNGQREDKKNGSPEDVKNLSAVGISDKNLEREIERLQITEKPNTVATGNNQSGLALTDSVAFVEELAREPEVTLAEDSKDVVEKPDEPAKAYRGLSVKLVVSPDYSTVKSTQPDKLGLNYGLLVEYGLTKNLSVATGLIRSNKFYSAHDIAYYGQVSDRVDGDCRMWDVPVMLYYTFSPQRTWSLYAGLGVSSYLMSKENYIYYIEGGYGNVYTYEQTIRGKNNEWFSILNLSVGLNKQLNTRWAIQLEPFYKAPLAGVGEGDVSLASLGAFFNLKYNFLNKK
ncbi:MAG: porin family protein [Cyclobacteriaceae bacterium]|nr:porin family protein [Cyclobacteriaceae bacterium]